MRRSAPGGFRFWAAALVTMAACSGGGGVSVDPTSLVEDVALLGGVADNAFYMFEAESSGDNVIQTWSGAGSDAAAGLGAAAPRALPGMAPTAERDVTVARRYAGGRPARLVITETPARGPFARIVYDVSLTWSSGPDRSGDRNDTAPGDDVPTWLWADFTATAEPREQFASMPATAAGWRHTGDREDQPYLEYDVWIVLPESPRAPYRRSREAGAVGVEAVGAGRFLRWVEYADGASDTSEAHVVRTGRELVIEFARALSDGTRESGAGRVDLGAALRCGLDDRGRLVVVRRFAAAPRETAGAPVLETLTTTWDGPTTQMDTRLERADGSIGQRSLRRTVVSPVRCRDDSDMQVFELSGRGYRGREFEATVTRTASGVTVVGQADLGDGTHVALDVQRGRGWLSLAAVRSRDGEVLAELELDGEPGGVASGVLRRHAGDRIEATDVRREANGNLRVGPQPDSGQSAQVLRRGEF